MSLSDEKLKAMVDVPIFEKKDDTNSRWRRVGEPAGAMLELTVVLGISADVVRKLQTGEDCNEYLRTLSTSIIRQIRDRIVK